MGHSAGGGATRSDAEGDVTRVWLVRVGTSGFEQLLQPFVSRSGELGEAQPGESSCGVDQRHTIGNRSDHAYGLHPDNRRSTFVSFQPAFSASTQANIAARPAPQNASDHTAVVSGTHGIGGSRSRRRRSPAFLRQSRSACALMPLSTVISKSVPVHEK